MALLGSGRWELRLSPLIAPLRGAIVCTSGRIFNLNVLLDLKEDVSHFGDFMFHQVLVERVTCSPLMNATAIMSSLHYKPKPSINGVLQILFGLYLDGEEVVDVLEFA